MQYPSVFLPFLFWIRFRLRQATLYSFGLRTHIYKTISQMSQMRKTFPFNKVFGFVLFCVFIWAAWKWFLSIHHLNTPSHLVHFCKTISIKFSKMKSREKKNVAEEMNSIRWERKKNTRNKSDSAQTLAIMHNKQTHCRLWAHLSNSSLVSCFDHDGG